MEDEAQMEDFVHRQNLALFRKLLAGTTDETQRRLLAKLIAEEDASADAGIPKLPADGQKSLQHA